MSLRSKLIRLAHTHPEFRKDLLPLLKTAQGATSAFEQIAKDLADVQARLTQDYGPKSRVDHNYMDALTEHVSQAANTSRRYLTYLRAKDS